MEVTEDNGGSEPEHQIGDGMLELLQLPTSSANQALPNLVSPFNNTSDALPLQTTPLPNAPEQTTSDLEPTFVEVS